MSGKTIHFPLLQAHEAFDIKYVLSGNDQTQAYLKKNGSHATVVQDFNTVLNDSSIALVVLTVPNHLHHEYVQKAIEARKHIVIEKPFLEKYTDAKKLFKRAQEQEVVLRVFHNRRYDGDFITVKNLIESGSLGEILSLSARFDRLRVKPKDGWRTKEGVMSGVFYDLGPHLFHYALSLFGLPMSVYCELLSDYRGLKTDDHFEAILYYRDFRVTLGAEQFARYPLPKFHIKGRKASYVKKGFDTPEFVVKPPLDDYKNDLFSKLYENDAHQTRDIPVKSGAHYRWYDDLQTDIEELNLMNNEVTISLDVIKTMEAAIESNKKERRISI